MPETVATCGGTKEIQDSCQYHMLAETALEFLPCVNKRAGVRDAGEKCHRTQIAVAQQMV